MRRKVAAASAVGGCLFFLLSSLLSSALFDYRLSRGQMMAVISSSRDGLGRLQLNRHLQAQQSHHLPSERISEMGSNDLDDASSEIGVVNRVNNINALIDHEDVNNNNAIDTIEFSQEGNFPPRSDDVSFHSRLASTPSSRVTSQSLASPCEEIQVAIVSAGYNSSRSLVTLIKSILFYRKRNPVHFHFVSDRVGRDILSTLFKTWSLPSVEVIKF